MAGCLARRYFQWKKLQKRGQLFSTYFRMPVSVHSGQKSWNVSMKGICCIFHMDSRSPSKMIQESSHLHMWTWHLSHQRGRDAVSARTFWMALESTLVLPLSRMQQDVLTNARLRWVLPLGQAIYSQRLLKMRSILI